MYYILIWWIFLIIYIFKEVFLKEPVLGNLLTPYAYAYMLTQSKSDWLIITRLRVM